MTIPVHSSHNPLPAGRLERSTFQYVGADVIIPSAPSADEVDFDEYGNHFSRQRSAAARAATTADGDESAGLYR